MIPGCHVQAILHQCVQFSAVTNGPCGQYICATCVSKCHADLNDWTVTKQDKDDEVMCYVHMIVLRNQTPGRKKESEMNEWIMGSKSRFASEQENDTFLQQALYEEMQMPTSSNNQTNASSSQKNARQKHASSSSTCTSSSSIIIDSRQSIKGWTYGNLLGEDNNRRREYDTMEQGKKTISKETYFEISVQSPKGNGKGFGPYLNLGVFVLGLWEIPHLERRYQATGKFQNVAVIATDHEGNDTFLIEVVPVCWVIEAMILPNVTTKIMEDEDKRFFPRKTIRAKLQSANLHKKSNHWLGNVKSPGNEEEDRNKSTMLTPKKKLPPKKNNEPKVVHDRVQQKKSEQEFLAQQKVLEEKDQLIATLQSNIADAKATLQSNIADTKAKEELDKMKAEMGKERLNSATLLATERLTNERDQKNFYKDQGEAKDAAVKDSSSKRASRSRRRSPSRSRSHSRQRRK